MPDYSEFCFTFGVLPGLGPNASLMASYHLLMSVWGLPGRGGGMYSKVLLLGYLHQIAIGKDVHRTHYTSLHMTQAIGAEMSNCNSSNYETQIPRCAIVTVMVSFLRHADISGPTHPINRATMSSLRGLLNQS